MSISSTCRSGSDGSSRGVSGRWGRRAPLLAVEVGSFLALERAPESTPAAPGPVPGSPAEPPRVEREDPESGLEGLDGSDEGRGVLTLESPRTANGSRRTVATSASASIASSHEPARIERDERLPLLWSTVRSATTLPAEFRRNSARTTLTEGPSTKRIRSERWEILSSRAGLLEAQRLPSGTSIRTATVAGAEAG